MPDPFAHCQALVRAADRDRFLSALFAPAEHRGALFALYAFNLEIARVREVARQPLAGEIRLQWWSDLLRGEPRGAAEGNPVAAALAASIARHRLSAQRLQAVIEAHRFDLYDEPMGTLADLESYLGGASCDLIMLAAQILKSDAPDIATLIRHAGLAYGIVGVLKAFPVHAARGQLFVPLEVLERHGADRAQVSGGQAVPALRAALAELRQEARRHLDTANEMIIAAPAAALPVLLPAALARPMLARMEKRDHDPFVPIEIAPWQRQWLLWRAARRPMMMFS